MKRLLLAGGGTAGSVTPLLALAAELQRRHPGMETMFLGSHDGPERALAEAAGVSFQVIPSGKLRRYMSWKNVADVGQIIRSFFRSWTIIRSWRPCVIVTAGSYVGVPVVWAGRLLGQKIVIHQMDVRKGLANTLMTPWADRVTVSFELSLRDFPQRKAVYTGNPVRREVVSGSAAQGRELFGLGQKTPVLLVLGGGTGSYFINELMSRVAFRLIQTWEIIHLTGVRGGFPELQHAHYHRQNFLTWQLPHAMAVADLVISRAGIGLISELAALRKATIFIPLPDTPQDDNARLIADYQAGMVFEQSGLNEEKFLHAISQLAKDPAARLRLGQALGSLYRPDALEHMATVVEGYLR